MKNTSEYIARAVEYLEKCEINSPYNNVVDIEQAKRALQMVELEHKIDDAKQLHRYDDMENYQKELKELMTHIQDV